MKKWLIILLSLFWGNIAFTQFSDSIHYYVNYAATGIINKTDGRSSYVLTNAGRFNIRTKNISLNTSANYVYGRLNRQLTNNDFSAVLDVSAYKEGAQFYYWGLANYDRSFSLRINHRVQAGLGLAYSFIDTKTAFFNVSDGLLYEKSNLKVTDSTRLDYSTIRNSFRLRFRFILKEVVVLDGTSFLQNALSDGKDYILKSNISLSIKLRKWLSINSLFAYNKVNRSQRENLLFTFGLSAETYF